MAKKQSLDKGISEIVGIFTDPIIVYPGGWGDSLPDWLKRAVTLDRLMMNVEALKTGELLGTDAEAAAYLYTAALTFPMDQDWANIYLYIATKVYERHRTKESGVTMPADIRVEKLSDYELGELKRLKRWLYEARAKVRLERERGERRKAKAAAVEEASRLCGDQLVFDFSR